MSAFSPDADLGILSRLPREIRDMIYVALIDDHFIHCHDGLRDWSMTRQKERKVWRCMKYGLSTVGDLRIRPLNSPPPNIFDATVSRPDMSEDEQIHLRDVSQRLQAEFDIIFLSKTTFIFDSPAALNTFCDQLSTNQLSYIRSIVFETFYYPPAEYLVRRTEREVWLGLSYLANLINIRTIGIGFDGFVNFHANRQWELWRHPDPDDIMSSLVAGIEEVVEVVDMVSKQIKQYAPKADIVMEEKEFADDDRMRMAEMLRKAERDGQSLPT